MGKVVKSFEECGKEKALSLLNEMRGECWTRVPRDAGKECAEILDENVRDVGRESRGMLNGTARGIVMPDSVPASVIIKNVLGNVKGTVRETLIESASKVRWILRRTLQRLPSPTTSF